MRKRLVLTILLLIGWTLVGKDSEPSSVLKWRGQRFNLTDREDLVRLREVAAAGQNTDDAKTRRGARQIQILASTALAAANKTDSAPSRRLLGEVVVALENNRRTPVPAHVDLLLLPFVHYRYARAKIGVGTKPAANLREPLAGKANLSLCDPVASTFWARPANIAGADLSAGFNRTTRIHYEDVVWTYAAPKTSYGGHAGFEVRDGAREIKIKFGEIHSEPFAARLFHALGYNVVPTDYSPGLKINYDRRLFTEFNSRKPVNTKLTLLGILPIYTLHLQPQHDPFEFIATAVLKDGTRIHGHELKSLLFGASVSGGSDKTHWNPDAESQIDHLITKATNVQLKDAEVKSIGPWDFGQLGHEHLRELRGAGLLAAWMGWADSRFDNTRLKVVKSADTIQLKHFLNDVGGGLGKANGPTAHLPEDLDAFPSSFTEPAVRQGKGRMTIPFRIVNFQPLERTPAFEQMTVDDARWMARLIAQLTEKQLVEALIASGFGPSDVRPALTKLISRREKMLRDLELTTPTRD